MARKTRTGPESQEQGKEYWLLCSGCDRPTIHSVIRSAEYQGEYEERGFSVSSWNEYQVVECRGCQTVSFRHAHRDTESLDHDPDTGEFDLVETVLLYPHRLAGRVQLNHVYYLPTTVQRVYIETLGALRGSMPILAAIGIRALVESMCKEHQAAGDNLERRLDALVEKGVVSGEGAEILHSLRLMGNQAAHETVPHNLADLNTAFDVIEHALQGVYILPKLAAKLPKRRKTAGDASRGGQSGPGAPST